MKKIILAIMAIVISVSAVIAQEPMNGFYAVTTTIKIRSAPTVKSEALVCEGPEYNFPANFLKGSIVNVIEDKGDWVKVKIYNANFVLLQSTDEYVSEGYIMKKFLTLPDALPKDWHNLKIDDNGRGYGPVSFEMKDGKISGSNGEKVSVDQQRNIIFIGDISSPFEARTLCYIDGKPYYQELYFFM